MRNIKKFGISFLLTALLFGCDKELDSENSIIGNWKLVGSYISSGGPQYLVEIEKGEEFQFLNNKTFTSNRYPECSKGNFSIALNELILKYDCSGFTSGIENTAGNITYRIAFESDYFLLTPTSVTCTEGCSFKYKKISDKK